MSAPLRPESCPFPTCPSSARDATSPAKIVRHSLLRTRRGTTPRWRCKNCGRTFTANHGTAYHRLRSSPAHFDRAVHMSVEGVSQSAAARTQGISPATVRRWLERAARHAQAFFDVLTCNVEPEELQADEVRGYTQFHPSARNAEVRLRGSNSGAAGQACDEAAELQQHLHGLQTDGAGTVDQERDSPEGLDGEGRVRRQEQLMAGAHAHPPSRVALASIRILCVLAACWAGSACRDGDRVVEPHDQGIDWRQLVQAWPSLPTQGVVVVGAESDIRVVGAPGPVKYVDTICAGGPAAQYSVVLIELRQWEASDVFCKMAYDQMATITWNGKQIKLLKVTSVLIRK